jgi:hypothetical protein
LHRAPPGRRDAITTTFRGTSTRGIRKRSCRRGLPASAPNWRSRNVNATTAGSGPEAWVSRRQFNQIDAHIADRHHDAVEFPDGNYVLVTQLCEGQRATVLQMPVTQPLPERAPVVETPRAASLFMG